MAKNNESNSGIWVFVLALAIGSAVAGLFNGGGSSTSSTATTYTPSVDTNSVEYKYAKERVRLEGYSDKESAQAAEAIIKFHNAQQNR